MKPLLILAPSSSRWPALAQLLDDEDPRLLDDLRIRVSDGVLGARDAFAVLPESSRYLGCACLRRKHDVGVLGQVYTIPDHRRQGRARSMMQALLSWFDMSGGRWLYLTCSREIAEHVFEKFGFRVLHAFGNSVTMQRALGLLGDNPYERLGESLNIRDVARADWPLMTALLQHYPGADPRVSLEESAIAAESTVLELLTQQKEGACKLKAAWRNKRIVGFGSVATSHAAERTYAMALPHDRPPDGLRESLAMLARADGCRQIDFPMETLTAK